MDEEKIKIKMDDGVASFFTRFGGNLFICWLVHTPDLSFNQGVSLTRSMQVFMGSFSYTPSANPSGKSVTGKFLFSSVLNLVPNDPCIPDVSFSEESLLHAP